jgi:DNA replication protein DnaC
MLGNPGTGKNHLSSAIMIEVMKKNYTALRIKATDFLDEYWAKDFSERESWMQRMGKVDLLVIDEIGRTSNGKSANDAFFRLIDARYEAVKPTIVISNREITEVKEILGDAAYDRLRDGGGSMVSFTWTSGRGD